MTTFIQFQMRRDITANWTSANPVLGQGELGLDTTLNRFKIGDGTTAYNSLGYAPNTVFGGIGAPAGGLGVNGDIYFDTTTGATKIYGPKAAGSWGSGVTLTGATGAPGTPGTTGATGPGVVVGGTAHQALTKIDATNFNTQWETINPAFVGSPPVGRLINTTAPLTGGGDLSADRTLAISAATTGAAGSMSAADKAKLDSLTVSGLTGWVDVTKFPSTPCLPGNTAAQNITAINAILAASTAGNTIYFPGGTYNFNAGWTMPAKQFTFQGQGGGLAGGFTLLAWTSVVGGDFITLVNEIWYTNFRDLVFVSAGVAQTAGAVVNINGNAFTNFQNCTFGGTGGGTLFDLMRGPANLTAVPLSDQSWNQSIISNCVGTSYKGTAIHVNARGSSLVVENSTFNGQWGTTSQIATAGIEGRWVGALQVTACDFIGHVNNMLLDPVTANSEVCASVQVSNTYFDFSLGSCIKVAGTGATVRCKWDTCTFTTSNASTGFSAVELAGSFVYPVGGQDLAFVNCNIYNTFATTGTTNGVLITNAADVSFVNCKVAGWTNGYNITPMASNKTNVQIIGGTCGSSGGFAGNSVGFLIGAGAYQGLQLRANNCTGNTTALTLGAVTVLTPSLFAITENAGINPRGAVAIPAVPASAAVVTNTTGFRVQVIWKVGTANASVTINGVLYTVVTIAAALMSVTLEPGGTFSFTGGTMTSWTWVGQ